MHNTDIGRYIVHWIQFYVMSRTYNFYFDCEYKVRILDAVLRRTQDAKVTNRFGNMDAVLRRTQDALIHDTRHWTIWMQFYVVPRTLNIYKFEHIIIISIFSFEKYFNMLGKECHSCREGFKLLLCWSINIGMIKFLC